MPDFGKINLAALPSHKIVEFPQGKGKDAKMIKCIVLPIEKNNMFISEKGNVYLDLVIFAMKNPQTDKDGGVTQTHIVKQSLPKAVRESMTREEQQAQPILGGMVIYAGDRNTAERQAEQDASFTADAGSDDDLPF